MAKLLSHPNNAIRQAVVQAMSVAEVEVALAPKEESVQDKIGIFLRKAGNIHKTIKISATLCYFVECSAPNWCSKVAGKKVPPLYDQVCISVLFFSPPKRSILAEWLGFFEPTTPLCFQSPWPRVARLGDAHTSYPSYAHPHAKAQQDSGSDVSDDWERRPQL